MTLELLYYHICEWVYEWVCDREWVYEWVCDREWVCEQVCDSEWVYDIVLHAVIAHI